MDPRAALAARLATVRAAADDAALRAALRAVPKYELHVHLAGSIRRSTIVALARRHGVTLPAAERDFLAAASPLLFFPGAQIWEVFHQAYQWYWSCVQSAEDLARIVAEALEDAAAQGVVHTELTLSGSYVLRRFPYDEWVDAVAQGIAAAQRRYPIRAAAILDISRRSGPEAALANVRQVLTRPSPAICGIGMGGDERQFPTRDFAAAFQCARAGGLATTVHVSEMTDAQATVDALELLQPRRLGHALTTIQSPAAYRLLRDSGVPVESCPLCNVVSGMGGIASLAQHPIRRMYEDGIPITINTDDPQLFGFDLLDNYILLAKEAGFTLADFARINTRAARDGFAPRPVCKMPIGC